MEYPHGHFKRLFPSLTAFHHTTQANRTQSILDAVSGPSYSPSYSSDTKSEVVAVDSSGLHNIAAIASVTISD